MNPADFGYDNRLFKPVFDVVEKYCDVNQAYSAEWRTSGHSRNDGWARTTDCSGFVSQFIHKLAQLAGVPSPFGNDYPSSQYMGNYGTLVTREYPPPNPRDLLHPGDVFVLAPPEGGKVGHTGLFMGYDPSGNPIIAHSTPTPIESRDIRGNVGLSGVRIEVMHNYRGRLKGIHRIRGVDEILRKLTS